MQGWEIRGQFLRSLEKKVINMEKSFGLLKFRDKGGRESAVVTAKASHLVQFRYTVCITNFLDNTFTCY
jgi:hypothetical protein